LKKGNLSHSFACPKPRPLLKLNLSNITVIVRFEIAKWYRIWFYRIPTYDCYCSIFII